jgi:hypothetical protein
MLSKANAAPNDALQPSASLFFGQDRSPNAKFGDRKNSIFNMIGRDSIAKRQSSLLSFQRKLSDELKRKDAENEKE